jgi:hypothetical protein
MRRSTTPAEQREELAEFLADQKKQERRNNRINQGANVALIVFTLVLLARLIWSWTRP